MDHFCKAMSTNDLSRHAQVIRSAPQSARQLFPHASSKYDRTASSTTASALMLPTHLPCLQPTDRHKRPAREMLTACSKGRLPNCQSHWNTGAFTETAAHVQPLASRPQPKAAPGMAYLYNATRSRPSHAIAQRQHRPTRIHPRPPQDSVPKRPSLPRLRAT